MDINHSQDYLTDQNIKPFFRSNQFLASVGFYLRFFRVCWTGGRLALKGKYDSAQWEKSSLYLMRSFEKVGVKISITGFENLKKFDGPAIFIGNHMSAMETFVLPYLINPVKKCCFIMKKELVEYPFFGPLTGARHPILVGRTNPREDLIKVFEQGTERLQSGRSIVVFPQKTRSEFLDENSFNTIGVKLAKKNNVPVVPIALVTDAMRNGKIIKDFGKIDTSRQVYFTFGEPFMPETGGSPDNKKVTDFIKQNFISWGREEFIR